MQFWVKWTENHYTETKPVLFYVQIVLNAEKLTHNYLCVFCVCPSKEQLCCCKYVKDISNKKRNQTKEGHLVPLIASSPKWSRIFSLCPKISNDFVFVSKVVTEAKRPWNHPECSFSLSTHPLFPSFLLRCPVVPSDCWRQPAQLKHGQCSRWILTSPGKKDPYFGGGEGLSKDLKILAKLILRVPLALRCSTGCSLSVFPLSFTLFFSPSISPLPESFLPLSRDVIFLSRQPRCPAKALIYLSHCSSCFQIRVSWMKKKQSTKADKTVLMCSPIKQK